MNQKVLQSAETAVIQIPTAENNYHAICMTRVVSSMGHTFTGIGEVGGGPPCKGTLHEAESAGLSRALELLAQYGGILEAPKALPAPVKQLPPGMRGNPITAKQVRYIETSASHAGKNMQDAEAISMELYGRPINALGTKEVNPIVDRLKA